GNSRLQYDLGFLFSLSQTSHLRLSFTPIQISFGLNFPSSDNDLSLPTAIDFVVLVTISLSILLSLKTLLISFRTTSSTVVFSVTIARSIFFCNCVAAFWEETTNLF